MPANTRGVLLRVFVFMFLAYAALQVVAALLYPLFGLLIASVAGVFSVAAIANALAIRIFERGTLPDIGLHWTPASGRHIAFGMAGGAAAAALIVLTAVLTRIAYFEPVGAPSGGIAGFVFLLLILLFGATGEEMLFRGYGFQVLVRILGPAATVLPMAVLFASVHVGNPDASFLALFNTFGWGVLLGWAILRSGDLWFPIGIHYGWNAALPLLGGNVSGFTMKLTGYTLKWRVGGLWSGGEYGLEGGLLCTLALIAFLVLMSKAPVTQQRLPLIEPEEESLEAS